MDTAANSNNYLGTERISRLVLKFAVPCVISLLVNSLYNLVDQIFIGWGVGYLGNGATNVVFPLTVIALSISLLIGDGAASYLNLKLGEGHSEKAKEGVGNAISLSVISSIVLALACYLFLPQLVRFFGATDVIYPYALQYGKYIVIGLPFMMISSSMNSIIRADGSPKTAMFSMIAGALVNIILDPLFIFVFRMGVEGAAIATTLGQLVSCIFSAVYLFKFKSFKITKKSLILTPNVFRVFLAYGVSSFITQISITIVMAVTNNMLVKYGADSVYGAEIPLTALGIVMKVNQILVSVLVGIAAGIQPIVSYNYGAGNYSRVRKSFSFAVVSAAIISLAAFLVFQLAPQTIVNVFGSESELYNEFARLSFRIFLLCCPLTSFQTTSGIFLQALGKPVKAALVSLSRQIILLVPAAVLLPIRFGVMGILWAGPCADFLSFILAVLLIAAQMKQLKNARSLRESHIKNPVQVPCSD